MSLPECREHHYGADRRCTRCGMRESYYANAMRVLHSWREEDKMNPAERWAEKICSFQCKPHFHGSSSGRVVGAEEKQP